MMYIIYDYAGRVKMEDATLISAEGALIPNGMKILEIVSNSRCFNIEIAHTHPVGGIPVATEDEVDVVRKNPGKIAIPPIPPSGLDSNIISMMEGATDKPIVYSVIDSGGRWAYDTVRQSRAYKNYIQHLKLRSRDIEGYAALATSQSLYWQDISKLGEAELIASQMYDMFCNQDTQYCALYAQKYPEQYLRMQQHGDAAKQQWTYNMSEKDMERFQKALEQSATEYLEATRPRTSHPSPKIVQRYEQALDDLVDDDQKLLTQNSPSAHYTYSIMKNRAENLENMDLRLHYTPLSDDTSEAR